jgi:hypothetical protein
MTQAPIPLNGEAKALGAAHRGQHYSEVPPAKGGHLLGFLKSVTYADGRVIQNSGGNPND